MIKKIFVSLMRRAFGFQLYKVHYLGRNIVPTATPIDNRVRQLKYDDFLLGEKEVFNDEKLSLIANRLQSNTYKAYGIIENNRLVYSCWISLENLGLPVVLKHPIQVGKQQGYLEDAYCSVIARGQGLHTAMIPYRLSRLAEYGKNVGIITVLDGNIPALKANLKSGMIDLGTFYCGKVFWKPFCTLTKQKKAQFDTHIK